jgi:16S rRNA processing protein RimM
MNLVEIGYFSKTHGIKGQLHLKYQIEFDEDTLNAVFIDSTTGKAPYFIEELQYTNSSYIVKLEEINTIEEAKKLVGKKTYIDEVFVIVNETETNWIGYELIDTKLGVIGIINSVSDNGAQLIVTINYKEKEMLLPLVEELIDKIDETNKKIYYKAPDGLIELYL